MNINILRYDSLGSTNTEAANQAKKGADEGLCIIADEQTAGRGRHSRFWSSEKDAGLYFSIVLRPEIESRFLSLITLMTGVAVCDALTEFGLEPDIKWVNDILVGERKISGILAETVDTPAGLSVIVGVGINLTSKKFPDSIADTATSLEAETGRRILADEIAEILTKYISYFYEILCAEDGPQEIVRHWHRLSSYSSGKEVSVSLSGINFTGITDGLEENGALRVRLHDGSIKIVQAGDVERLRKT